MWHWDLTRRHWNIFVAVALLQCQKRFAMAADSSLSKSTRESEILRLLAIRRIHPTKLRHLLLMMATMVRRSVHKWKDRPWWCPRPNRILRSPLASAETRFHWNRPVPTSRCDIKNFIQVQGKENENEKKKILTLKSRLLLLHLRRCCRLHDVGLHLFR